MGNWVGNQLPAGWLGHTSRMGLLPVFGRCLPRKQKPALTHIPLTFELGYDNSSHRTANNAEYELTLTLLILTGYCHILDSRSVLHQGRQTSEDMMGCWNLVVAVDCIRLGFRQEVAVVGTPVPVDCTEPN